MKGLKVAWFLVEGGNAFKGEHLRTAACDHASAFLKVLRSSVGESALRTFHVQSSCGVLGALRRLVQGCRFGPPVIRHCFSAAQPTLP